MAGKLKVMCWDKTGTLTKNGFEVAGVALARLKENGDSIFLKEVFFSTSRSGNSESSSSDTERKLTRRAFNNRL